MAKKPTKELTPEQQAALEKEKPFKCPICDYRAKLKSLVSRHVNHFHTELLSKTPKHLLQTISGHANVSDMLVAVAEWVERNSNFDEHLPEDVVTYLRREDAKTQLVLRVIAIGKIQRALDLADKIKELEVEFSNKLGEKKFKDEATPTSLLSLIERMQTLQESELSFLKSVATLGEVNLADVIDKLVGAFGTSKFGGKKSAVGFQLTGVALPDDPGEREQLRTILRHIGAEDIVNDESGGADSTIEAEYEEGT